MQLEIWPELDLAGFSKNGRILDFPEPKLIQYNPNTS